MMEQVYKEIGRKPRDEERRSYHFKHLREMKDKANKKERLMKQYQQQLDDVAHRPRARRRAPSQLAHPAVDEGVLQHVRSVAVHQLEQHCHHAELGRERVTSSRHTARSARAERPRGGFGE